MTNACGLSARHAYIAQLVNLPDLSLVDLAEMARQLLPLGMWEADEQNFKPTEAQLDWHNDLQLRSESRQELLN